MKKIVAVMVFMIIMPLFGSKLDLADPLVVENFGANIVKEKLDSYDADALGLWYLRRNYRSKWSKVREDEFELNDAKEWAFNQLKKKLEKAKPINKDDKYHMYVNVRFGKYDFKSRSFPVEALTPNSYMSYRGKGEFVSSYSSSKLTFENANEAVNFIPMKKEDAKKFIQSRKDRYGNIDRDIVAHYTYKITNVAEADEFTSDGRPMTLNFTGKLESVEFMDKKRKHILHKVNFSQLEKNTTNEANATN